MLRELAEIQRQVLEAVNSFGETKTKEGESIPDFPSLALPEQYYKIISEVCEKQGFSEDFVALAVLTICASCIGNTHQIKVRNGWYEPPILFSAIIGNPSVAKTPALKFAMNPIIELQKQKCLAYENDHAIWEEECKQLEKGEPHPPEPTLEEYIINDSTMESLIAILHDNPRGLLLFMDELIGFFKSLNQYRKGADQEKWLSIWSAKFIKVNRRTGGAMMIDKPVVSILGSIQPSVLTELAKDNRDSNGFIYRILFAFPKNGKRHEWNEEEISQYIFDRYSSLVKRLLSLQANCDPETNRLTPKTLCLSDEAKDTFVCWYNQNVALVNETDSDTEKSIFTKLEAYVVRFALILELMYWSANESDAQYVSKKAVIGAVYLVEYFRATALKVNHIIRDFEPEGAVIGKKFKVNWDKVFDGKKEMKSGQIVDRLIKLYEMSERTANDYKSEYLVKSRHGFYKRP